MIHSLLTLMLLHDSSSPSHSDSIFSSMAEIKQSTSHSPFSSMVETLLSLFLPFSLSHYLPFLKPHPLRIFHDRNPFSSMISSMIGTRSPPSPPRSEPPLSGFTLSLNPHRRSVYSPCLGKNYHERVMLIYDGLHYDALAMSPSDGAPEEFDQTIFMKDGTVGMVERLALNLVREQQRKRSYTDTANFTLRCGVCQIGVIGQKEAVEHAQATGHVNFQEYK